MGAIVGIDLGGTRVKVGVVQDGAVIKTGEAPTVADRGSEALIEGIVTLVKEVLKEARLTQADIEGLGMGVPSQVSHDRRTPIAPPNLTCLKDVPIAEAVAKVFDWPWALENDANAAALGERLYGGWGETQDLVILTLGTGVGGGVISGGKLLRGPINASAELGHILVDPQGRRCGCGRRGCLEAQISTAALLERYRKLCPAASGDVGSSPQSLAEAAAQGDLNARQVFDEMGRYLGTAIADLVNVFGPDLVILGGGISRSFDLFRSELVRTFNESCKFPALRTHVRIEPSRLINDANILGAVAAFEETRAERANSYAIPLGQRIARGCVLSVQIGVTRTHAAVVDAQGRLVATPHQHCPSSPEQRTAAVVFGDALQLAKEAAGTLGDRGHLSAVVLIVPAGVDREAGRIHTAPAIPDLAEKVVPNSFFDFGVPVFLENDANAALLFEHRFGSARGLRNVLGIHLVSGLGGAFICGDMLVVGKHGHATELGHIPLREHEQRACLCRNFDCLERYASGSALSHSLRDYQGDATSAGTPIQDHYGNYMDIVLAAEEGNVLAVRLLEDFAQHLAEGLVPILNVFDPGAVVFTGALSRAYPFFRKAVTDTVETRCFADIGASPDFRQSADPLYGDLRGAAVVATSIPVRRGQ